MEPSVRTRVVESSPHQFVCFPFAGLFRYFYAGNPFYVISAALVMAGLHMICYDADAAADTHAVTFNSWLLFAVLGGYTLLLAGTACLIVRIGRVWDDARTIVLTVLLLLVAISVSFDKLVLTNGVTCAQVLVVGSVFSWGLTGGLLRALRIRLPVLFRGPLYLAIGLFFLYPVLLMHLLDRAGDGDPRRAAAWTIWGIFLFPAAAAAVTLSLLPAVWKGPAYVAHNGTPWRWPLFPWSVFVVLGVGIVLRSYWLSISFHPYPGTASAFGVYFLVPFLLAACAVLFELGRSVNRNAVQTVALTAPLFLLWFSLPGTHYPRVYAEFLALYTDRLGSPVLMTWLGLLGLYLYAWLRGARQGEIGLVGLLAFGSLLGRGTVDFQTLQAPSVGPLVAGTLSLLVQAIRHANQSHRWFLAAAGAIGTLTVGLYGTPFVAFRGAAPVHLLLGTTLMLGLVFRDEFARLLRELAAIGLAVLGVACLMYVRSHPTLPDGAVAAYLASLSTVAWSYWHVCRGPSQFVAAVVVTGCWVGHVGLLVVGFLRRLRNPTGSLLVLSGLVSFLIAPGISLIKARVWSRLVAARPDESNGERFPPRDRIS